MSFHVTATRLGCPSLTGAAPEDPKTGNAGPSVVGVALAVEVDVSNELTGESVRVAVVVAVAVAVDVAVGVPDKLVGANEPVGDAVAVDKRVPVDVGVKVGVAVLLGWGWNWRWLSWLGWVNKPGLEYSSVSKLNST